jgi:hypothetical protein
VTLRTLHALAWTVPWLAVAAAADAPLDTLRQGGEVSCRSPEPFFCENVHVRCAGRTAVETFPFALRAASGSVELVTAAQEFQRTYQDAKVEWGEGGSYVLLMPRGANGYVKLLADGKYVFRHYIGSLGVMSLGTCR